MGERAHTPGPWRVSRRYEVGPISDADDQSCGMVLALCDVYGDNRNQDARLIAAAPDMFDALLNVKGLLDTPLARRRHDGDPFYEDVVASLNAALAKASPHV